MVASEKDKVKLNEDEDDIRNGVGLKFVVFERDRIR